MNPHMREILREARRRQLTVEPDERIIGFSLIMFEHFSEHRDEWRALIGSRAGDIVRHSIQDLIIEFIQDEIKTNGSAARNLPPDLFANYLATTFISVVSWWLSLHPNLSPVEINKK